MSDRYLSDLVEDVALDSDYLGYVKIQRRNATTGKIEKAVGLTGVEMFFSLTEGGAAIDTTVRWSLVELVSASGFYAGMLETAPMTTHLKPLGVGAMVWKALVKPGDVTTYRPCRLVWRRPEAAML